MAKTLAKMYAENAKAKGKNLTVGNFFAAARFGRYDQMQSYLEDGGKVDVTDYGNRTALIWSSTTGDMKSIEMLIKFGANVDHQDENGVTALQCAARNGYIDYNQTPLHEAANFNKVEVCRILLENGADKTIKHEAGMVAIDYANDEKRAELKTVLSAHYD